jgi:hypothetical protein
MRKLTDLTDLPAKQFQNLSTQGLLKRSLPLVLLFLLGGGIFAEDIEKEKEREGAMLQIEEGFAIPIAIGHGDAVPLPGLSLGCYYPALNKGFGVGAWLNMVFPLYKDGSGGFAFDLLLGPGYTFPLKESLFLPVAVGFYLNGASAADRKVMNLGIGANVTVEWHFNSLFYAYGRLQMVYAIGGGGEFLPTPALGVGISM